jgi:hypothetical protein
MLPQGYFSGPKVTYIREVGASDFVRCPIRYVCYLIRASYATYIREVGASDFVRCLIRYVCYLIHASYSTYATSYVSHTLISSFTAAYTSSLRPHTLIAKGVIH